jgi:hypothetical protein
LKLRLYTDSTTGSKSVRAQRVCWMGLDDEADWRPYA